MLADLFRLLAQESDQSPCAAEVLGFDHHGPRKSGAPSVELPKQAGISLAVNSGHTAVFGEQAPYWDFPLFYIEKRSTVPVLDADTVLQNISNYDASAEYPKDIVAPECPDIVNRHQLADLLQQGFLAPQETRRVDVAELTNRVAALQALDPIPRLVRPSTVARYWVLADELPTLATDSYRLQDMLGSLAASLRPEARFRLSEDKGCWFEFGGASGTIEELPALPQEVALLVVGDPKNPGTMMRQVLKRWRNSNTMIRWLSPFQRDTALYWCESGMHAREQRVVDWLLALLYAYPGFSRAMVRVLRRALGGNTAAEIAFWQHADLRVDSRWCDKGLVQGHREQHRAFLHDRLEDDFATVSRLHKLMIPDLNAMPAALRNETLINLPSALVSAEDLSAANTYFASLSALVQVEKSSDASHSLSQVVLSVSERLTTEPGIEFKASVMRAQSYWRNHVDAVAALQTGTVTAGADNNKQAAVLLQQGKRLVAAPKNMNEPQNGVRGKFTAMDSVVVVEVEGSRSVIPFGETLPAKDFILHAVDEQIHVCVTSSARFHWAENIVVGEGHEYVETEEGVRVKAGENGLEVTATGDAPGWLQRCTLGIDDYGVYALLPLFGVEQRMRWIGPGQFMMGSPEDEAQREDDEVLHEVNLTQGFWLADTACTQVLYEAVLSDNPSHFKGTALPVEQVSFEDVQRFLERANREYVDLQLTLPTEAEWEYACRAGTDTPFSIGENITPDQVNYDGTRPYNDAAQGKDREKTLDVIQFEANEWGMYQMHGNVWEWCEDWFGSYEVSDSVNPAGPQRGESRVLRGGSWANDARYCRSAYRFAYEPSLRDYIIGFRLAQVAQPRRAERVQQAKPPAAEARRSRESRSDGGVVQRIRRLFTGDRDS